MNGALGRSLEYSMYTLGRILKAPFGIFQRQTLGHILGQTKGQNPSGLRPLGFLAFGLALDVALGLLLHILLLNINTASQPTIKQLAASLITAVKLTIAVHKQCRNSLNHLVSHLFVQSSKHLHSQTVRARDLRFRGNVHHRAPSSFIIQIAKNVQIRRATRDVLVPNRIMSASPGCE